MSWKAVGQVASLLFLGIISIGALLGVGVAIAGLQMPDQIGLPLLVIVGSVVMLLTLASISILFGWWTLADRTQALALPEGSIRAVIALPPSLVLFSSEAIRTTGLLN
jgi:hypothetical protein